MTTPVSKAARLYKLQRAMFESLRPDQDTGKRPELGALVRRCGLSEEEAQALLRRDIRALYLMGVHSVLLNSFARANGLSRHAYASLLEGLPSGLGTGRPDESS